MTQGPRLNLVPIDDPAAGEPWRGRPLAIVATGPSYDLLPAATLEGVRVWALNAAITEFVRRRDVLWVCHDLWTIFRGPFGGLISGYRPWRVVTRRAYVPGPFGDVEWKGLDRDAEGRRIQVRRREPFPWRMRNAPPGSTVYWYCEWDDLPAPMRTVSSVIEIALDVAALWGAGPIVLVGFDGGPVRIGGREVGYGSPWAWKPCALNAAKALEIREAVAANRARWPAKILTTSPHWPGSPFERTSVEEALEVLRSGGSP